ncbi:PQQ-binding-like beta-propeller repeat protein [uncultured Williamsia sp.]|uniref:Rv3212 family protein n=1 Tax=uncultured Williamsia sp. TaxID=259311 RepID=UPI002608C36E|nr:PQQ-binding-like beta-propeller repeat protein [uncultured Williamsia sp.]
MSPTMTRPSGSKRRIRPERRTRTDLIVSAVVVVVVVVIGAVVWWVSPSRHTEVDSAPVALQPLAEATAAPATLVPGWTAPSPVTPMPVVTESAVVTADGGSVVAHDPDDGSVLWSYRRNLPLCGVIAAYPSAPRVVAAYRNSRGCGEVTALRADDGRRSASRSSDADEQISLSTASDYVVAQGDSRLESWGSSLVRGVEYGRVSAPVQPNTQPRSGCRLQSSATGADDIAVVEQCPDESGYRLTVIAASQDKDGKVTQLGSRLITDGTAGPVPRVVAVSSGAVAVYRGGSPTATTGGPPATGPEIRVYGTDATLRSTHEVLGATDIPPNSIPVRSTSSDGQVALTVFTGSATVVLDPTALTPRYQIPGTLGPAVLMGSDLVVPGPSGITVVDPATGEQRRTITVSRPGYTGGTVGLTPIGTNIAAEYDGVVHMLRGSN